MKLSEAYAETLRTCNDLGEAIRDLPPSEQGTKLNVLMQHHMRAIKSIQQAFYITEMEHAMNEGGEG